MELSLPSRLSVAAGLLGAALMAMGVSVIRAPLGLVVQPAIKLVETHANPLVLPVVTLLGGLTVLLLLLALRWAIARGTEAPDSIVGRNRAVFVGARVVGWVYLAQLIVEFVGSETKAFLEIELFNVAQLDMLSPHGQLFLMTVPPLVGILSLILLAPRIFGARVGNA